MSHVFHGSPPCVLRQDLSLNLNLVILVWLIDQHILRPPLYLSMLRLQGHIAMPDFLCECKGIKLRPFGSDGKLSYPLR